MDSQEFNLHTQRDLNLHTDSSSFVKFQFTLVSIYEFQFTHRFEISIYTNFNLHEFQHTDWFRFQFT